MGLALMGWTMPPWLSIPVAFIKAFWKPLLLVALIGGLFWWGYDSASDKAGREAKLLEVTQQRDTARQQAKDGENSRKAAEAARGRNDVEIPRIRSDTAARADRAASADAAQRVQDVSGAVRDYTAAANQL